jgi:hypothetical protein
MIEVCEECFFYLKDFLLRYLLLAVFRDPRVYFQRNSNSQQDNEACYWTQSLLVSNYEFDIVQFYMAFINLLAISLAIVT